MSNPLYNKKRPDKIRVIGQNGRFVDGKIAVALAAFTITPGTLVTLTAATEIDTVPTTPVLVTDNTVPPQYTKATATSKGVIGVIEEDAKIGLTKEDTWTIDGTANVPTSIVPIWIPGTADVIQVRWNSASTAPAIGNVGVLAANGTVTFKATAADTDVVIGQLLSWEGMDLATVRVPNANELVTIIIK